MVLIVVVLTMFILLAAVHVQKRIGEYGITVISKIMGLILASYAVQSIANGGWSREAQGTTYNAVGNVAFSLSDGADYTGGGAKATLVKT